MSQHEEFLATLKLLLDQDANDDIEEVIQPNGSASVWVSTSAKTFYQIHITPKSPAEFAKISAEALGHDFQTGWVKAHRFWHMTCVTCALQVFQFHDGTFSGGALRKACDPGTVPDSTE
jgi:hypothetical protein